MYNEIILSSSNNRLGQHIDFFKAYMTDIFQINSENASSATFSSNARGSRKFYITRSGDYSYFEFLKLNGTRITTQVIFTELDSQTFTYKLYKNGETGVLLGFSGGILRLSIIFAAVGSLHSIILNNVEYSASTDATISSLLNFPIDSSIFKSSIKEFDNNQELIHPVFGLSPSEVTLSSTAIDNIYQFTNFAKIGIGQEINVNGENYVKISNSKILRY